MNAKHTASGRNRSFQRQPSVISRVEHDSREFLLARWLTPPADQSDGDAYTSQIGTGRAASLKETHGAAESGSTSLTHLIIFEAIGANRWSNSF